MSRILLVHNFYQQPGGEDSVFRDEARLLRAYGHEVLEFTDHNDRIKGLNVLQLATETVWNSNAKSKLESLLRKDKPDVVHIHNTFPLISPSVYLACHSNSIPVVQTLHNYRLMCPAGTFYRNGVVCEECVGKVVAWPSIKHGCYRSNRLATSVVATMLGTHRLLGTWARYVHTFIALSEFSRRKFVQGGLPADKLVVKPNFLYSDPGWSSDRDNYALFVGRLSPEKGCQTLLAGWQLLSKRFPIRVYGDGPLQRELESSLKRINADGFSFEGRVSHDCLIDAMKRARFVIVPSGCYENFPMAVVEAFACGVPVLVSRRGVLAELVADGHTGIHFDYDDPDDLAAKLEWAWDHPNEMLKMGIAARSEFEHKYSKEENYLQIHQIYDKALKSASPPRSRRSEG